VHNHSFFYCCNHDGYVLFFWVLPVCILL
jgi:hypothetical protein